MFRPKISFKLSGVAIFLVLLSVWALSPAQAQNKKIPKLFLVAFNEAADKDSGENAIRAGLKKSGLIEKQDYELKIASAQGDIATLIQLVDQAVASGTDVLIPLQSVSLQATVERSKGKPVVFHLVSDPVLLGVASSDTDHLPNVTGSYSKIESSEIREMLQQLKSSIRGLKKIGTLYVPGEVISMAHKEALLMQCQELGIELKAVPVDTVADLTNAIQAMLGSGIQAVVMVDGSITNGLAEAVLKASNNAKIPVFGFTSLLAKQGAVYCIVPDVGAGGREAGMMVAKILKGASPKNMPFFRMPSGYKLVNTPLAKRFGLDMSPETIKGASEVVMPVVP